MLVQNVYLRLRLFSFLSGLDTHCESVRNIAASEFGGAHEPLGIGIASLGGAALAAIKGVRNQKRQSAVVRLMTTYRGGLTASGGVTVDICRGSVLLTSLILTLFTAGSVVRCNQGSEMAEHVIVPSRVNGQARMTREDRRTKSPFQNRMKRYSRDNHCVVDTARFLLEIDCY